MKHNLMTNYGKVNRQSGRVVPPQFRCSCGKWNRTAKASTDIEHQRMLGDFELHCASVGHALRTSTRR